MIIMNFETTKEIKIPKNPFDRIIGQEEAVEIAKLIPKQKRNLLLVGPPGTGKSMIAQAIAYLLPKPKEEISVVENPENPDRPLVEIRTEARIKKETKKQKFGVEVSPYEIPYFVAEGLGFRCKRCGEYSDFTVLVCPSCSTEKTMKNPFDFIQGEGKKRMTVSRRNSLKQEIIVYERTEEGKIIMLTQEEMKKMERAQRKQKRKILVPLKRSTFVRASGSTETEFLGDIRHDPYGSHPQLGTPSYQRVVPGALHEAHEGVLFIDELSTLGEVQRHLLSAMQDKICPIVGRNPMSSGAAVRVENVPCDFILVGACNINDLQQIIPPLRSRIRGSGYEILMKSYVEDTEKNRKKFAQFVAQEIVKDGKIPHATKKAVESIIEEARKMAKRIDKVKGLTLRLRNVAGIIKLAGDLAVYEESEYIEPKHIKKALIAAKPIEEKIKEEYGNWWNAGLADYGITSHRSGTETA